jgi:hypothetical protein
MRSLHRGDTQETHLANSAGAAKTLAEDYHRMVCPGTERSSIEHMPISEGSGGRAVGDGRVLDEAGGLFTFLSIPRVEWLKLELALDETLDVPANPAENDAVVEHIHEVCQTARARSRPPSVQ